MPPAVLVVSAAKKPVKKEKEEGEAEEREPPKKKGKAKAKSASEGKGPAGSVQHGSGAVQEAAEEGTCPPRILGQRQGHAS